MRKCKYFLLVVNTMGLKNSQRERAANRMVPEPPLAPPPPPLSSLPPARGTPALSVLEYSILVTFGVLSINVLVITQDKQRIILEF